MDEGEPRWRTIGGRKGWGLRDERRNWGCRWMEEFNNGLVSAGRGGKMVGNHKGVRWSSMLRSSVRFIPSFYEIRWDVVLVGFKSDWHWLKASLLRLLIQIIRLKQHTSLSVVVENELVYTAHTDRSMINVSKEDFWHNPTPPKKGYKVLQTKPEKLHSSNLSFISDRLIWPRSCSQVKQCCFNYSLVAMNKYCVVRAIIVG